MKSSFASTWKKSKQPRKQRKYQYNAPAHIRGKFLGATLSKELREKYSTRSIRIRTGDKVRIIRGAHKGKEGKIESVDVKKTRIYISKVEVNKKDGSKAQVPIHPSNVMIIELNLEDKKRKQKLESKKTKEKTQKKEN